jgi:hypothetical protein
VVPASDFTQDKGRYQIYKAGVIAPSWMNLPSGPGVTHEILSIIFNEMQDGGIFEERIYEVDEPAIVVKTTAIQATGQNWKYSTDFRFPYSSRDQHLSCVTPAERANKAERLMVELIQGFNRDGGSA